MGDTASPCRAALKPYSPLLFAKAARRLNMSCHWAAIRQESRRIANGIYYFNVLCDGDYTKMGKLPPAPPLRGYANNRLRRSSGGGFSSCRLKKVVVFSRIFEISLRLFLEARERRGIEPRKHFSGKFSLRLEPATHEAPVIATAGLDGTAVIEAVARKRGCLLKGRGGEPDCEKAAAILLTDYRSGALGRISLETPELRALREEHLQQAAAVDGKKD